MADKEIPVYEKYIASLNSFSKCFYPIIKAHSARYIEQQLVTSDSVSLENYCIFERREVMKYRQILKEKKGSLI